MKHISELRFGSFIGKLGLFSCPGWRYEPGKDDPSARTEFTDDLMLIQKWGAKQIISLITADEIKMLGVLRIGMMTQQLEMEWIHLPIQNYDTPSPIFMTNWPRISSSIRKHLQQGTNVGVHCKGGYGRSGTVSAMLLVDEGMNPSSAIELVRNIRPGTIETKEQERFILEYSQ